MNLASIFHKVVGALKVTEQKAASILGFLEQKGPQIEHIAELAVPIIQKIATLAPNRTLDELAALATQFSMNFHPSIAADPLQVEGFLQNVAVVEMQKILPGVPNAYLRTGISAAFNGVQADVKLAATATV